MSDSPEHPNSPQSEPQEPQEQQELDVSEDLQVAPTEEPTPTSAAPGGLAPSPGIEPPSGMAAPALPQPQYTQPEFTQPEFTQPDSAAPQYIAHDEATQQFPAQQQYAQQQFSDQPYGQDPAAQQPYSEQPYGQDPAAQQPYADQPYGQNPAAAQYAPAPGGPGGPAGPGGPEGPAGPGAPKKGLSTGAIIGIVGGAVALVILLIVGGIFAVGAMTSPSGNAGTSVSGSDGKKVKAPKTAEGTVELFLNSVADGDATTARKLAGGSTSDELLTDEALANTLEVAAITNIVIDESASHVEDYEATVSATFDIGDTTINRDFKLWKTSNSWEIFDGLVSISLDSFKGLEPEVNGIELGKTNSIKAFPGAYQITLGVEAFELDSNTDTFVLANRNDTDVFYETRPQLTEAATEEFRTLVTASLNECLAVKTFATPCGFEVDETLRGGEKVIDGTITRTIGTEGDAKLKRLKPETNYSDPSKVTTYEYISVTMTAEVDNAGTRESGQLTGGGMMLSPIVDFSAAEPTVTWE